MGTLRQGDNYTKIIVNLQNFMVGLLRKTFKGTMEISRNMVAKQMYYIYKRDLHQIKEIYGNT